MKCHIHGIEMHYAGENPFGGDIWVCDECEWEEEEAMKECPICGENVDFCDCWDDYVGSDYTDVGIID